jgi:predicted alpha/beta-fold hydrolase
LARFYHSGDTADLDTVLAHALAKGRYRAVGLVGFSLGGNITLKYLGEKGCSLHPAIRAAATFSVPCDLASGAAQLARRRNALYMRNFLRALETKVREKVRRYPGLLPYPDFRGIRDFRCFDERFTAPLHGFSSAEDYWTRASSRPWLARIRAPTLLVNAADDPFLGFACYPTPEARASDHFHLEIPHSGGHAGFVTFNHGGEYWSEVRAADFLGAALEASLPRPTAQIFPLGGERAGNH